MGTTSPPPKPGDLDENPAWSYPISTATLFGDAREITIDHDGEIYRLRITRQGKLILNK